MKRIDLKFFFIKNPIEHSESSCIYRYQPLLYHLKTDIIYNKYYTAYIKEWNIIRKRTLINPKIHSLSLIMFIFTNIHVDLSLSGVVYEISATHHAAWLPYISAKLPQFRDISQCAEVGIYNFPHRTCK